MISRSRSVVGLMALLAALWVALPGAVAEERSGLESGNAIDLDTLEAKLRQTDAIGLTTKFSLKQDLDGLIADFRAFHDGKAGKDLGELKGRFAGLLDETLIHLKSGDPVLYRILSASRPGLWEVISDGPKFRAAIAKRQKTFLAAGPKR